SAHLYARVHLQEGNSGPRRLLLSAAAAATSASSDHGHDNDPGDDSITALGPTFCLPLASLVRGVVPLRYATKVGAESIAFDVFHAIESGCRLAADVNI